MKIENYPIIKSTYPISSVPIEAIIDYPESIEVTVCKNKIRFFHPSVSLMTDSERELFTIGSDRVAIDGVFGSANYRRVGDIASLVKGDPQRTLQYTLERKIE